MTNGTLGMCGFLASPICTRMLARPSVRPAVRMEL